ncbi:ATP-dependent DNA ligase [Geomonas agri]|uniref:ATP-dependent DNA ligase n=1 Tax=Geomonas agri TaxID=2873702 RepID=UPI001CD7259B|nr:hypothetical protein [Geomonas agri]
MAHIVSQPCQRNSPPPPSGPPEGPDWLHEIKLDGFRLLCCRKDGCRVDFYTRNGHRWSFSAIAAEIRRLPAGQLWLDGEIVVMAEEGRSSFGALQTAIAKLDQVTPGVTCLRHHAHGPGSAGGPAIGEESPLCLFYAAKSAFA